MNIFGFIRKAFDSKYAERLKLTDEYLKSYHHKSYGDLPSNEDLRRQGYALIGDNSLIKPLEDDSVSTFIFRFVSSSSFKEESEDIKFISDLINNVGINSNILLRHELYKVNSKWSDLIISKVNNLNLLNRRGESPLILAIMHCNLDAFQALVERGSSIHVGSFSDSFSGQRNIVQFSQDTCPPIRKYINSQFGL